MFTVTAISGPEIHNRSNRVGIERLDETLLNLQRAHMDALRDVAVLVKPAEQAFNARSQVLQVTGFTPRSRSV